MTDTLLEDICRNRTSVIHACTALPWDRASMEASANIEKILEGTVLRGSWCHWSEILTAKLGSISTTADTGVSTKSDLSPVHDSWVIGLKIVTILTMLGDDRITQPLCRICLVAWAIAAVDLEQTLTDHVSTEVADTISSLAEGGCGCSIDNPRMGKDLLYCDSCRATWIEHS